MAKRHAHGGRRQTLQSNTYRFFVPPESIRGDAVQIEDAELIHQISSVLRLGAGDQVLLLDNTGWQYSVTLSDVRHGLVAGEVGERALVESEPRAQITLYLALMRPERFEWALQKSTELGIAAIVPVTSERTLLADSGDLSERKAERWRKIIREASEQSRRGRVPHMAAPMPLAAACAQAAQGGTALLLWEGAGAQPLRQALAAARSAAAPQQIALISGPEGGFADHEREAAQASGVLPITLGPRTLRAETAPLAALAAVLYDLGDMD